MSASTADFDPLAELAKREYFCIHRIVRKKGTNRVLLMCENVQDWRSNQEVKIVVVCCPKETKNNGTFVARVTQPLGNRAQTILEFENPAAQPILAACGYVLRHRKYYSNELFKKYYGNGLVSMSGKKRKFGEFTIRTDDFDETEDRKMPKILTEEQIKERFKDLVGSQFTLDKKKVVDARHLEGAIGSNKSKVLRVISDARKMFPDFCPCPTRLSAKSNHGKLVCKLPAGVRTQWEQKRADDGRSYFQSIYTGKISNDKPESWKWNETAGYEDEDESIKEKTVFYNDDYTFKIAEIVLESNPISFPTIMKNVRKFHGARAQKLIRKLEAMEKKFHKKPESPYLKNSLAYTKDLKSCMELWEEVGLSPVLQSERDTLINLLVARFFCENVPFDRMTKVINQKVKVLIVNEEEGNRNMYIDATVTREDNGEAVFDYERPQRVKSATNPKWKVAVHPATAKPEESYDLKLDTYFQYVKKPCGLNQVWQRIQGIGGKAYETYGEIQSDIRLIQENAQTYWARQANGGANVRAATNMLQTIMRELDLAKRKHAVERRNAEASSSTS